MWLSVLLLCCIHLTKVEALTCLTCQGIQQPRHCRSVEECAGVDNYCITETLLDTHGQEVYNLGCMSEMVCKNGSISSHTSCRECCSGDLCNAAGCGQPGYPLTRGPICYDCPMTIGERQCMDITYCQADEVCFYQSRMEFSDNVSTRGCASPATCSFNQSPTIVGKRDQDTRVAQYTCDHCCNTDLCNRYCNDSERLGEDCYDLLHNLKRTISGIYTIRPRMSQHQIVVYCDMVTSGGGWTVFQHRASVDVDFYRNMSEYVHGFGKVSGNFWLGLEPVFEILANWTSTLYIKVEAVDGTMFEEHYNKFSLSTGPDYRLHVGPKNGSIATCGYDMSYTNGYAFSTFDDDKSVGNCSTHEHTGWWHVPNYCTFINLNGNYTTPGTTSPYGSGFGGMIYYCYKRTESLKQSTMMFRRE